jgi:hypothetical protein
MPSLGLYHGMQFAPQKYTLTHFTRKRNVNLEAPIRINNEEIAPSPVVRILGLQLDSRLRWKAHIKAVNQIMTTQMYALSRIAASTWGATMEKARRIYLAVVCPAISYGSTLWQHMALYYTEEADRRQHLRTGGRIDYQQLVGTNGGARKLQSG